MDFNKFLGASFVPRTVTVKVPELKDFFGTEKPEWTVRNLTGAEFARAKMVAQLAVENMKAIAKGLSGDNEEKVESFKRLMGIAAGEVPADTQVRIEILTAGSVSPTLGFENRDVAVKLSETFPTRFIELTDHIYSLTGQGAQLGKRKPSGKAAKSDQT